MLRPTDGQYGLPDDTRPLAVKFLKIFRDYPLVVCPSGSCVAMVRHHYHEHLAGQPGFEELVGKTYELCEFLVDVLKVEPFAGSFPHKVGIHQSCHGLRGLRMASSSEIVGPSSARCGTCWSDSRGFSYRNWIERMIAVALAAHSPLMRKPCRAKWVWIGWRTMCGPEPKY